MVSRTERTSEHQILPQSKSVSTGISSEVQPQTDQTSAREEDQIFIAAQ